jgi:FAD/FMN-containing dehydrogenase
MDTTRLQTKIETSAIDELRTGFGGQLIGQDDPAYEERRRIWNGSIDRRPGLIARCAGVADVIAAVKFARKNQLQTAIRSGGHSFPGFSTCDDGFVIDLSLMRGIRVDPDLTTVRAQAGALLGELDRETQAFGMAVPSGIVTHTGMAGLTLGGGIGWLMRKYGLTIDQLVSVDLVTADGDFVRASEKENPDLFWGVRGAGANFGIVTDFEFRLNPLNRIVLAGPIFWPMEQSAAVMRFYRDWVAEAPDDLTTVVVHRKLPASPAIPPELHGRAVSGVMCCYAGPVEDGEKVIRPLKSFGSPLLDMCAPKPFLAHQASLDPSFPAGRWYYFKSCNLNELSDPVIDIIADQATRSRSPLTAFPLFHLGGAIARVGEDETAYTGRNAAFTLNINATTETSEGYDEERDWSRNFWSALEPYHANVYVNFLMEEGEARVRQAYGAEKYDRLKALKRKYDPDNFFRLNQNIPPA